MRVTMWTWDDDEDKQEPLGAFVLEEGAKEIQIDCPPDGRWMFTDILKEKHQALSPGMKVGEWTTATEDPEGWLRGLLIAYHGSRFWAGMDAEDA